MFPAAARYNRSMDNAIMKLQEIVSHQQEELSRLSDELYLQQKHIAELQEALRGMRRRMQEISESQAGDNTPEPPPPHY